MFRLFFIVLLIAFSLSAADELPSWNEGKAKQAVIEFVQTTTDPQSSHFIQPDDRIVAFDQDGTLWVEHPIYAQAAFALDRVKQLAPDHPDWKEKEPFRSILSGNEGEITKFQEHDWVEIIAATHAGMSNEDFLQIVTDWFAKVKHPRFQQPYTKLTYQPMLELLNYLRTHGFKTYIVTGGGQEFVRSYSQSVYSIPPEQVIGSSIVTKFEYEKGGIPSLVRVPKVFFNSNYGDKPVGINLFIGKKPSMAVGNSDGDKEMLEWTQGKDSAKLMMLIYHDDEKREYCYGPAGALPDTHVGTFSEALMLDAKKNGWIIVSMKDDWKHIFSFDK